MARSLVEPYYVPFLFHFFQAVYDPYSLLVQVSNWFINARVRLWKPMVEEMYKEEIGDADMDSNSSSDNATKVRSEAKASEDREELQSMKSAVENK